MVPETVTWRNATARNSRTWASLQLSGPSATQAERLFHAAAASSWDVCTQVCASTPWHSVHWIQNWQSCCSSCGSPPQWGHGRRERSATSHPLALDRMRDSKHQRPAGQQNPDGFLIEDRLLLFGCRRIWRTGLSVDLAALRTLAVLLQLLLRPAAVRVRERGTLFHFITSGLRSTTLLEPSWPCTTSAGAWRTTVPFGCIR